MKRCFAKWSIILQSVINLDFSLGSVMKSLFVLASFSAAIVVLGICGCDTGTGDTIAASTPTLDPPQVTESATPIPVQQSTQADPESDPLSEGFGGAVSDLMKKAKQSAPSMQVARKWLNDAGGATSETADETMEWVNKTYKYLSDQGLTTAKDAKEWVSEDWNAINAWEYKVVEAGTADVELLDAALNESGKARWECFHVSESPAGTRFYMKRQKRSYLKNIPLKDLLKLVPLLDSNE